MSARRRLLLYSAPAVVIALLIAAKLLSLPLLAGRAADAFADRDGRATRSAGSSMAVANVIAPYKAHLAIGDGAVLDGDYRTARREFTTALAQAPPEAVCPLTVNLVIAVELAADARAAADDADAAARLYRRGLSIIAAAPQRCVGGSAGTPLGEARDRLADKSNSGAEADPDEAGSDDAGSGDAGSDAQDTRGDGASSRLQQLQQQRRDSTRERDRVRQQSRHEPGDGPETGRPQW